MNSIVGYTGFVGSNIVDNGDFQGLYNSRNVSQAFGTRPDLLVYAGLKAEKFLANSNPDSDWGDVLIAQENIKRINPSKIVLISTVDVYPYPVDVDENTLINVSQLPPYGKHRFLLEKWVEENIDAHLIIRLPGLFGKNIKKNFIFDYIKFIPSFLSEKKYKELSEISSIIKMCYGLEKNGFYKYRTDICDEHKVMDEFKRLNFSALNFTDSRSVFQFYNLAYLWRDIQIAEKNGIKKLNIATEPISVEELYKYLAGDSFTNVLDFNPLNYNFRSVYADCFCGSDGYLYSKQDVMRDIKNFVEKVKK